MPQPTWQTKINASLQALLTGSAEAQATALQQALDVITTAKLAPDTLAHFLNSLIIEDLSPTYPTPTEPCTLADHKLAATRSQALGRVEDLETQYAEVCNNCETQKEQVQDTEAAYHSIQSDAEQGIDKKHTELQTQQLKTQLEQEQQALQVVQEQRQTIKNQLTAAKVPLHPYLQALDTYKTKLTVMQRLYRALPVVETIANQTSFETRLQREGLFLTTLKTTLDTRHYEKQISVQPYYDSLINDYFLQSFRPLLSPCCYDSPDITKQLTQLIQSLQTIIALPASEVSKTLKQTLAQKLAKKLNISQLFEGDALLGAVLAEWQALNTLHTELDKLTLSALIQRMNELTQWQQLTSDCKDYTQFPLLSGRLVSHESFKKGYASKVYATFSALLFALSKIEKDFSGLQSCTTQQLKTLTAVMSTLNAPDFGFVSSELPPALAKQFFSFFNAQYKQSLHKTFKRQQKRFKAQEKEAQEQKAKEKEAQKKKGRETGEAGYLMAWRQCLSALNQHWQTSPIKQWTAYLSRASWCAAIAIAVTAVLFFTLGVTPLASFVPAAMGHTLSALAVNLEGMAVLSFLAWWALGTLNTLLGGVVSLSCFLLEQGDRGLGTLFLPISLPLHALLIVTNHTVGLMNHVLLDVSGDLYQEVKNHLLESVHHPKARLLRLNFWNSWMDAYYILAGQRSAKQYKPGVLDWSTFHSITLLNQLSLKSPGNPLLAYLVMPWIYLFNAMLDFFNRQAASQIVKANSRSIC